MTVFHPGGVAIPHPEIRKTVYAKDFGDGFYCTANYGQAERWARRDRNLVPTVNRYSCELLPGLSVKKFPGMSDEWLDFIADCRSGKDHAFDVVEGPMADDTVWNYVNDFISGTISREAFWALARFNHPTHQLCFHTEQSLRCLAFLGADRIQR